VLGIDFPFIKPYITGIDISVQITEGSYLRYWKEIFEFNQIKYFVTSQWFDRDRESFSYWFQKSQGGAKNGGN